MCPRGVYDPPATGPLAGLAPAQMENLLLRAVLADLKAGGWDPASISSRSKCELGERLKRETGLPLRSITGFLRISRSSYECRRPRRRRLGSYEGETDERPPNLPRERAEARRAAGEGYAPDHDFSAAAPGVLAVTDVTELAMDGYKCYLSPVVDCFDGMPAAWSLSLHPDSALCSSSLRSCLDSLSSGSVPTAHTDGGGPYRSAGWKELCSERGVTRSMSRSGRSGDNAPAEGLFGTFRTEFLEPLDRAGVGLEELREAIDGYMEWYGDGRLKRFEEPGGGRRYETISGRHRRLGVPL